MIEADKRGVWVYYRLHPSSPDGLRRYLAWYDRAGRPTGRTRRDAELERPVHRPAGLVAVLLAAPRDEQPAHAQDTDFQAGSAEKALLHSDLSTSVRKKLARDMLSCGGPRADVV